MIDIKPEYAVVIHSETLGITIRAPMPEDVSFDLAAQYEAPFSQGISLSQGLTNFMRVTGMSTTRQIMTAQIWQGNTDIQFSIPLVLQAETDEMEDVLKPLSQLMKLMLPKRGPGGLMMSPGPHIDLQLVAKKGEEAANAIQDTFSGAVTGSLEIGGMLAKAGVTGDISLKDLQAQRDAAEKRSSSSDIADNAINQATVGKISLAIGTWMVFPSVVVVDVQQVQKTQPLASGIPQRVDVTVTFKTFVLPMVEDLEKMYLKLGKG